VVCPGAPLFYQSPNSSRTARDLDSLRRVGIQNGCDHGRISVSRRLSHTGFVPHLRRWASGEAVSPALAGWATVFRASGAAFRITNHQSPIPNSGRRVSHHESRATIRRSLASRAKAPIPNRLCPCADPQPAVSICRSQIDRDRARAPEARQMVAQPGRAGTGGQRKFEHRRCDTSLTLGRLWHGGAVFSYFRGISQPQTY
jgi:hypothetical protein